jgi:AcrR family transcriptional regulator
MARSPDHPVLTDRARRRRSELLDAARRVFEDVGYSSATVADIVRVSGGSRASFYSYFTSADDALLELVEELADGLFDASTSALASGATPFETLTSSIRQFMHAYRDRAPLLAVLDQATVASNRFRGVRLEIRMRFAGAISEALGRRPRDPVAGLDVESVAVALGGMVEDMARGRYLLGQEIDEEVAIRTLAVIWARAVGVPVD